MRSLPHHGKNATIMKAPTSDADHVDRPRHTNPVQTGEAWRAFESL
jgi:hypothetical protein